jgi:hypothetical protein
MLSMEVPLRRRFGLFKIRLHDTALPGSRFVDSLGSIQHRLERIRAHPELRTERVIECPDGKKYQCDTPRYRCDRQRMQPRTLHPNKVGKDYGIHSQGYQSEPENRRQALANVDQANFPVLFQVMDTLQPLGVKCPLGIGAGLETFDAPPEIVGERPARGLVFPCSIRGHSSSTTAWA